MLSAVLMLSWPLAGALLSLHQEPLDREMESPAYMLSLANRAAARFSHQLMAHLAWVRPSRLRVSMNPRRLTSSAPGTSDASRIKAHRTERSTTPRRSFMADYRCGIPACRY